MSSIGIHVTCPHCGTATATTTGPTESPSNRLKGARESCANCESGFELYYY
jgi:transcription elongation factor Elf1